jgi:glycosyltransferase involved in cell wall biosynthesis
VTVLFIADTRFPIERANGVQTMATCQALAERGHDVTLIVRPDTAPVTRDPFEYYGVPRTPGLSIRAIGSSDRTLGRRVRFLQSALRLALLNRNAIVLTRDLGLAALMCRLPRALRPRLAYESHGIAPVVSEELPRLLGKPELAPSDRKIRRLDARERRVWAVADAYICLTRALAADLTTRYGTRDRVFVVPDGATPRAAATQEASRHSESLTVGYAGHLYPWKGVDVLVRALASAPFARALIVGGHPGEADRARIEALARELGVADRVEMTGLVPPSEVATRLSGVAVLVLPNVASTISERYTSPLKLFEYLWLARPIVASDSAAIREILTDGRTARLVPPGDPEALAAALAELRANPVLARTLSRPSSPGRPGQPGSRRHSSRPAHDLVGPS